MRVGELGVDDPPQVAMKSRAALVRGDEQRLDEPPLLVSQIARMRQASIIAAVGDKLEIAREHIR